MRSLVVLAVLVTTAVAPRAAHAAAPFEVHIVSRDASAAAATAVADETPKHARARDGVLLYAVIVAGGVVYSDAPRVRLGRERRARATRPLAQAGAGLALRWFRVEPTVENLSNEASGAFRYEAVPYEATELVDWRGHASARADVRPTLTTDRGGGLGTMRYQLLATLADVTLASPGVDARRGGASGGLTDAVHRVSLRADDSYLGWLTEMYGQPYIWASAGPNSAAHQSERLEGSDCADFVVYGWRRLGHDVAYTWTGGLPAVTRLRAAGARRDDGIYVDAQGQPLAAPAPGDLMLFPRHVGVFVRDAGVPGVLDEADVIVQTLFESPHESTLAASGYVGRPVEVRRWKE
jgi:hypothetical protein